jgi:hypothetical protein
MERLIFAGQLPISLLPTNTNWFYFSRRYAMNSIQNQAAASGMPSNYSSLSDAQVASYMRKQAVTATESLKAGLTIQTKEGDIVTLASNSYAQLDAFMYNSQGVLQTADGTVAASVSQRQVTLATGESFSFSVIGDLSEEELADIEDIVKGIDGIIAEMAQGDMAEAVEKAMAMGTYDTVSMYAADISYEKNVAAVVETQAREAVLAAPEAEILPKEESALPTTVEPFPENHAPKKRRKNSIKDINRFVERMAEKLDNHPAKLVKKAEKAIDKLFNHHLEKAKDNHGGDLSTFNAIENTYKNLDKYIDKMMKKMFDAQMALF